MPENITSKLHEVLEEAAPAKGTKGSISLFDRFAEIKNESREWLRNLQKNGWEHSERLERYLEGLTVNLLGANQLTHAEIFVLLCAAYMHDLGYWHEGRLAGKEHEKRSEDFILSNPEKYHLGDFPIFGEGYPRAAKAIALACHGHAKKTDLPLSSIPSDFADQAFQDPTLNLKRLAALLRVADGADDPYIRLLGPSPESIRSQIPLVEVRNEKVVWYWDRSEGKDPWQFETLLEEKKQLLESSLEYLREIGAGDWSLVLHPQVTALAPFMAKEPVDTFVGRGEDLEDLHRIIMERGEGAITGVVGTGGIGKTELARMYTKKYKADYPAGILWASLRGSSWREEARKILEALYPGWKPDPFPDDAKAKEEICRRLNRKGVLLVIDNVNEDDEIIRPGCAVLVTTRDRGAFGMLNRRAIHQLGRLSDAEGKDLLVEVLGADRVARDPKGASRIVEILGGMPLAIDIAARHMEAAPDLSFPDYIGQIQWKIQELKLKDIEDKDVVASLELSLKQLESLENGGELVSLFEAASVCAEAGFSSRTLAEAAGLGGTYPMAIGRLAGDLHKRSLLEFDQKTNRYSMHPLLRQLAEERLKKEEKRELLYRRNHCNHFLQFAEANNDSPEVIISEKDGLWQAMVQANQIGQAPELLPRFLEHLIQPYEKLIAHRDYETAFQYLMVANLINIYELGLVQNLVSILQVLVENQAALKEPSRAWVYISLGVAYHNLGEYRKAIDLYEKRLEIARRIGDVRGEGNALGNMGMAYARMKKKSEARECFEKSKAVFERLGLKHMVAQIEDMMKSSGV
jgi:tetratricopeptide (TPR) repeat protein